MKILYLTKYTRMAGSSRMRSYQYFPYFEKAGYKITVKPFFDDAYLKGFYTGKKNMVSVLKSYLRRFFVLFSVFKYDKVVIEKEIFPFLPASAEWLLSTLGIKYIVDYDDAIFHNYDLSPNPLIKRILGNKIAKVMKYSGAAVLGNRYLAQYASVSGAKNIHIIPTVIDLDRYSIKKKQDSKKFVVGWIGTKTTFEKHLLPCREWIKEIQKQDPNVYFHIIGITNEMDLGKNVKYIQWSEKTEVEEIMKMDVGIMPLQDSPWEKGKCSYKLIQYAACGIPGVASDIGMNSEVIMENETGFLVDSQDLWIEKILNLKSSQGEKKRLGNNGRKLVEEKFCLQVLVGKWENILNSK